MRLALLLLAGCAGYRPPPELIDRMFALDLSPPPYARFGDHFTIHLEDQAFRISPWLRSEKTSDWWPRDQKTFVRRSTITNRDGWKVRCETTHEIAGGFDVEGVFHTERLLTTCTSETEEKFALLMDAWPRVDGFVASGSRQYSIRATDESEGYPDALLVARGDELVLVVARDDRAWMRTELEAEERHRLVQIAAVLWAGQELRLR